MSGLTHLDEQGAARMVDVGSKAETARSATATGRIAMKPEALSAIRDGTVPKGDVLAAARIAGIIAAKQTGTLIPLCHPLPIHRADIDYELGDTQVKVIATVETIGPTGVEMEALTAASVAALTVYDMCKAVDRGIRIENIRLVRKRGGQSGDITLEE